MQDIKAYHFFYHAHSRAIITFTSTVELIKIIPYITFEYPPIIICMIRPSFLNHLYFKNFTVILTVFILIFGSLLTLYTVKKVESKMKNGLLEKARIAANSINKNRLNELTGTLADTSNPNYQRIKHQLKKMREAYPHCKFLYLMGKNNKGEIYFFADSQSPNSKDYAKPGLIYNEVSNEYRKTFETLREKTVGPIEDRWGKLMTALIPIKEEKTDELIAMLGMDVTIKHWIGEIIKQTGPMVLLIILGIILVFYIQQLRYLKKQREAERQIKKSTEHYQALFEQAADGILIGNEKGVILDANESMFQLTGYSKNELIGKKINLLFNKEEIDKNPFDYQAVLSGKMVSNERSLRRKEGTTIFIEMNTKKVGDGRLQAFFRDITDRKKSERLINEKNELLARQKEVLKQTKEKAIESDRLKSVFLANMSHEIRTPMNGIIGFSELLTEQNFSEKERKEFLHIIHSLSLNLLQIIDDIIDISKIEANQLTISKEVFYINDLLEELYTFYQRQLKHNENTALELVIHKALPKDQSKIYCDLSRLKQILNNLLVNALKFTKKGTIEFGYKPENNEEWLFFVKDTGVGIPDNKQDKIFERFRQVDETHTGKYKGTGLGLFIVKSILTKLNGIIWVESEYGKGSTFWFTLPK